MNEVLPVTRARPDTELSRKTVHIFGRPAVICGYQDDPYFQHLEDHIPQNALFMDLANSLPPEAVVIDVGANIGVTSVMASRAVPSGLVISVEPAPRTLQCLRATVAENAMSHVLVEGVALAAEESEISFEEATFLAGSYATSGHRPGTTRVRATTLDALVERHGLSRIDLVKVDVEGFELDFLKGATRTIERFSPRFLMEFSSFTLVANRNISPRTLLRFVLDRFGSFWTVWGDGRKVRISTEQECRDLLYANMTAYGCADIVFGGEPCRSTN